MFFLGRPSDAQIRRVLDARRELPFSYPEVGETRSAPLPPPGYPLNHHRGRIGTGPGDFARGVEALRRWTMYDLPWTEVHPPLPLEPGGVFAAVVHHFGFWSVNPCRIVYVEEDRSADTATFAFAIGTLPGHGERGEERFRVEWHRRDDAVWLDLFAFAGPAHWLTRLGSPLLVMLQRRFGRQALHAVRQAVSAAE